MKSPSGYGLFYVGNKATPAHRWIFERKNGQLPKHLFVCHRCDNRPCVNPNRLFAGTHAENMRDMRIKGRGTHKLLPEQVAEIKRLLIQGHGPDPLALMFGVSKTTIARIGDGGWSHVAASPDRA